MFRGSTFMMLRATSSEWCWANVMLFFFCTGRKGSGESPYSTPKAGECPWSLLMFVGTISMWHPLGPAQHHSQVRQKKEQKNQNHSVQEHDYDLRGFEVTQCSKNFFLCESPWCDFGFFVCFVFFFSGEGKSCIVCFLPAKSSLYFHALLDDNLLNAVCSIYLILL